MPKVVRECSPLSGKSSNEFSRLRAKPEGLRFQAGVCGCLETCMVTSLSTERRGSRTVDESRVSRPWLHTGTTCECVKNTPVLVSTPRQKKLCGALATFPDDQLQAGGAPRCHLAVNCNWEEMRRNGEQEKTPSVDHTQGWPTGRRRRCGEACPPWGQPSPPAWVWPGLGADAAERAGQPADRSGGPRGHRAAARP